VLNLPSVAVLDRPAALPGVARVERDGGAGTGTVANTVPKIGANTLHTAGATGTGVTGAVLDTGADTDHPDLAGAIEQQACLGSDGTTAGAGFCADGTDRQTGAGSAEDNAGDGTHVTGIVTSNGIVGPVGVAPGAGIVAVKVMDGCSLSGCFHASPTSSRRSSTSRATPSSAWTSSP
jgi:subtilisin family serine protease